MARIKMVFIINLLALLFSAALIRSDQSMLPLKSFKINVNHGQIENVTYDCIDIYKQRGLDHPLLKNHKIQMKPSVSRHESKNQTDNNKTYIKKFGCPYGTVPILKNSKEFITKSQLFSEKYVHPLSGDSPGTHIAGLRSSSDGPYRGIEASFNGYTLNIAKDQASYSQMYVGSGLNNQVNFIQTGFMMNPSLHGDGRLWTYGYWKGKDGKGCYNTLCPGFVQVSHEVPLAKPIDVKPGVPTWLPYLLHQDKESGNWWITQMGKRYIDIGYWPKELFNLLENGANMVGVGGVVQASRSGPSPPMGNGKFPNGREMDSAMFANIEVLNSYYLSRKMDYYPEETMLDSPKCYGLRITREKIFRRTQFGYHFNYGGPGGKSCGV